MKKVRRTHFWLGIVAMVFLLIQSVTGLTLYFSADVPQGGRQPNNMQQGWDPARQDSTDTPGTTDGDESEVEQGDKPSMGSGVPDGMQRPEGMPDMEDSTIKSLHKGIIGLVSGIGLLLMSVTGLILAFMIGLNKRKQKKRTK